MKGSYLPAVRCVGLLCGVLCGSGWHLGCNGKQRRLRGQEDDVQFRKKALDIARGMTLPEGGPGYISSRNSRVRIRSPRVRKVVAMGPQVLPYLVEAMRQEEVDFNAFTYCYSACQQILRKVDPEINVFWNGGCDLVEGPSGLTLISPGHRGDVAAFRKRVVDDIVSKCARYKLPLRKPKQGKERR